MSDSKPEASAGQGTSGPTRRQILKAAAAATPIIMSIKARPAMAVPNGPNTPQNSAALSHNLSTQPARVVR